MEPKDTKIDSISFTSLEVWVKQINEKLDNHLIHVSADIAQIKNDIDWIKRFFWLVAGTSVTSIIGAMFAIILR